MNLIPQIGITITGITAVFLMGTKKHRKWGCIMGLMGQPFWFWETASKDQWMLFAMSVLYTASWINGLRNNWRRSS